MTGTFLSFGIDRRLYVYHVGKMNAVRITGQIYSDNYKKGHPVDIYVLEPKKKKPIRLRVRVANTRKFGGTIYKITKKHPTGNYKVWATYIQKSSKKIPFKVRNPYDF